MNNYLINMNKYVYMLIYSLFVFLDLIDLTEVDEVIPMEIDASVSEPDKQGIHKHKRTLVLWIM